MDLNGYMYVPLSYSCFVYKRIKLPRISWELWIVDKMAVRNSNEEINNVNRFSQRQFVIRDKMQ